MAFDITSPGLATTVQDQGRTGHYNVGIPQSGSLDQYSAELGNALVGNTAKEAVLECTYLGPALTADQDVVIAVTGARLRSGSMANPATVEPTATESRRRTQLRRHPGRHTVLHRGPGRH